MRASLLGLAMSLAEQGRVPDPLVRWGIRKLCAERLRQADPGGHGSAALALDAFVEGMDRAPVAPVPHMANEQHYELPPAFFREVLGPRLKYSSCWWPPSARTLEEAEEAALSATCERAEISDGLELLELGCGWGSLTLFMAERFPRSRITTVSNSAVQRGYIEAEAARRRLGNVRVLTADMNAFRADDTFDRVVSVEMFEHMRNWRVLLSRIASWLRPGGTLFVHVFRHRAFAYAFETEGEGNWMGRHFFTGGIMPSDDLIARFQDDLRLASRWRWSGTHYARTSEAWLERMDARREAILPILAEVYGPGDAERWFHRWRIFFLSCAELFGYQNGEEWGVSHYLMEKPVEGGSVPWRP